MVEKEVMENPEPDPETHIRKRVLEPLEELIPRVIKGLKEFNIHFPIQKIAYLEIQGDLAPEGLEGFREELLEYLEKGYRFKKFYWNFIQRTYALFDKEMKKDGSSIQGFKYYQALRIDMYLALFGLEGRAWSARFDSYIGKIRERVGSTGPPPRTGEQFLADLKEIMETPVGKIKKQQKSLLASTRRMQKRIIELRKNPSILMKYHLLDPPTPNPAKKRPKTTFLEKAAQKKRGYSSRD